MEDNMQEGKTESTIVAPEVESVTAPTIEETPIVEPAKPQEDFSEKIAALELELKNTKEERDLAAQMVDRATSGHKSMNERMQELETRIETQRQSALESTLQSMGVEKEYRKFAPSVDPHTAEGREALQTWAQAHPKLVSKPESSAPPVDVQAVSEKANNPFLNRSWLQRLIKGDE